MKTIFITGASSGIGKAAAKLFASRGWQVIATMRSPEKETELTKLTNVQVFPLDVTNKEQTAKTIASVLAEYDIDVLFNNAGYGMKGPLEEVPEDELFRLFDTDLLGSIRVIQAFNPHFKKRKSGLILTTKSITGSVSFPLDSVYNAAKELYVKRNELGKEGFMQYLYNALTVKAMAAAPVSSGRMQAA